MCFSFNHHLQPWFITKCKKTHSTGNYLQTVKNTLFSDLIHSDQRKFQHNRRIQLRENRKQERRMYWKDLIKIEIAAILSIAWFIQMELIRTKQVHSRFTSTQMQKFPTLQRDVAKQASRVYNDMYRGRTNSQFIICDIGNDQLDGRIGYVDWFDADNLGYRSLSLQWNSWS